MTRRFVKTSFIYFALALIIGLLIEAQSTLGLIVLGGLFPVYQCKRSFRGGTNRKHSVALK